jgi:gliding motility-associated-like protein
MKIFTRFLFCLIIPICFSKTLLSQSIAVAKKAGGSGTDYGNKVAVDDSNNVYMCGFFSGTSSFSSTVSKTSNGGTDVFLAKYDCNGTLQWVQTYGGANNENNSYSFLGLGIDTDHNVVLSGLMNTSGTISSQNGSNVSITSSGGTDAIIVKYSSGGNIAWYKKYGGSGNEDASNLEIDEKTNDIIVFGLFSAGFSIGSTVITNSGNDDVFVCKLNSSGAEQWAVTFGNAGYETTDFNFDVDNSGNIYISGNTDGSFTLGSRTVTHSGAWGGWFTKLNSSGAVQWVINGNNSGSSCGQAISVDEYGFAYISSSFYNSVTWTDGGGNTVSYTSATSGVYDVMLAKVSPSGNFVWTQRTTGTVGAYVTAMRCDEARNIYFAGYFGGNLSYGTQSTTSAGSYDIFLMKTDSNGVIENLQRYGGTGFESVNGFMLSKYNSIYLSGSLSNTVTFGSLSLTSAGATDAYYFHDRGDSSFTFLPADQNFCAGTPYTITPSVSAVSYLWSTSDTTRSITVSSTGWYKLRIMNNCFSFWDSIYVNFQSCPCVSCNSNNSINDHLLFCLPFNGNANDESGNGYNGSVTGATLTTDRNGNANRAYSFNGSSSYITLANNLPDLTNTTFSCWIKPSNNPSSQKYVFFEGDNNCGNDYSLGYANNQIIITSHKQNTQLNGTNTTRGLYNLPSSIVNNWINIVFTTSPTQSKLYICGTLVATFNVTSSEVGYHHTPTIGAFNDGNGGSCGSPILHYFTGAIDDIRMYDTVLSVSQIQSLCNVSELPTVLTNNDTSVCIGDSKTLIASGTVTRYLWSTGDTTNTTTVSPTTTTTYWVIGSNSTCTSDTVKVTVNVLSKPTITISAPDTICPGDYVNLTVRGTNNYKWSTSATDSNLSVNPLVTTTYWVVGSNGYCNSDSGKVTITVRSRPLITVSANDTICLGESTTLSARGLPTYVWNTSATDSNITVNPLVTTTYWAIGTDGTCFSDTAKIVVTVVSKPVITVSMDDTICIGDAITLRARGATIYQWNTTASDSDLVVSPSVTTSYWVLGGYGACTSDTGKVTITVVAKPVISISPDDTICVGESTILGVRGATTYMWSTTEKDSDVTVSPSVTTTYWAIGSNGACGSDTQKVTVVVLPKPTALFGASPNKGTAPLTVQFTNLSSYATTYLWEFGDGDTSTTISPTHIYTDTGTFVITLYAFNSKGCSDTFRLLIVVKQKYMIFIPDAFSPDGNGINDFFEVYMQGGSVLKGEIYDRWGEMLYEWTWPGGKWWDGTYKNEAVQTGLYIYILNVKDTDNYRHIYKGTIKIFR